MENISSVNESRAQMREIITSLIDYTKYHFGREEKLMQVAVGYRDIEKHKREHAMFIEKVEKYVSAFCAGQEFSEDITVFLYSWLVNHINGTDKALAEKLT